MDFSSDQEKIFYTSRVCVCVCICMITVCVGMHASLCVFIYVCVCVCVSMWMCVCGCQCWVNLRVCLLSVCVRVHVCVVYARVYLLIPNSIGDSLKCFSLLCSGAPPHSRCEPTPRWPRPRSRSPLHPVNSSRCECVCVCLCVFIVCFFVGRGSGRLAHILSF